MKGKPKTMAAVRAEPTSTDGLSLRTIACIRPMNELISVKLIPCGVCYARSNGFNKDYLFGLAVFRCQIITRQLSLSHQRFRNRVISLNHLPSNRKCAKYCLVGAYLYTLVSSSSHILKSKCIILLIPIVIFLKLQYLVSLAILSV